MSELMKFAKYLDSGQKIADTKILLKFSTKKSEWPTLGDFCRALQSIGLPFKIPVNLLLTENFECLNLK